MSYSVLVIPEDATNDHYILKPIISAVMSAAGKSNARVRVLTDPAAQGVEQVLSAAFLDAVVARYPMVDLFLLCVDRDGSLGRDESVQNQTARVAQGLTSNSAILGVCAHQELEVWCLAGMRNLPKDWAWSEVRAHRDPKENYYRPYARMRGLLDAPADGREALGREAGQNYKAIVSRCPEVLDLQKRIIVIL